MTINLMDPDRLATEARAALEATVAHRVDSVRRFVETMHELHAAEEAVASARAECERAWAAALTAGWTEKELRGLGVHAPGEAPGKQPRRRRAATSSDGATSS